MVPTLGCEEARLSSSDKYGELPPLAPNHLRNADVKCLRCGAFNVSENRVCGKCGANLPLIYDEEGKIFNWRDDPYFKVLVGKGPNRGFRMSPGSSRWVLRFGLLLFACFLALWIMRQR